MNAAAAGPANADVTEAQAADRRQAEYFRRVLHERYTELRDKIAGHQRLLIQCQNRDEPSEASRMRRTLRDAENERKTLRRLIEAINARFFTDAPIEGTASGMSASDVSGASGVSAAGVSAASGVSAAGVSAASGVSPAG